MYMAKRKIMVSKIYKGTDNIVDIPVELEDCDTLLAVAQRGSVIFIPWSEIFALLRDIAKEWEN